MKNLFKIFLLPVYFLAFVPNLYGQLVESHNQYYLAPYLINPGSLGAERVFGIDLNYRKLYKEIPEAPESFKLLTQIPVGNNLAVGLTAFARRESIFESVGGMATVSYRIPFSADGLHFLSIGLSAGYAANQANESLIDNPFDPAVANLSTNPGKTIGQFGIAYQWENLSIGLALNDMFNAQPINYGGDTEQAMELVPFNQSFSYVKYNFNLSDDFKIVPWVSYATAQGELENGIIEGLLMFNYKEVLWAGASYINEVGPVFRVGFSLKRLLKIGYGYGINTATNSRAADTHEMHLSYRMYDIVQEVEEPMESEEEPEEEEELIIEEEVEAIQEDSVANMEDNTVEPATEFEENEIVQIDTATNLPEPETTPTPVTEEIKEETSFNPKVGKVIDDEPGNYIIVGAFSTHENAEVYAGVIRNAGYDASIGYKSTTGYHYVVLAKEEKIEIATKILSDIRTHDILDFKQAWILTINPK